MKYIKRTAIIVMIFCVMAMLISAQAAPMATEGYMNVYITAECSDYNHVGDEWYEYSSLNGYEIHDGDELYMYANDTIELYTAMTEYDATGSDVGEFYDTVKLTRSKINRGFTIQHYIPVYEDKGIYKGYWCEWYVTYEFVPAQ